ncbi:cyclophane-forming radical SAM/SPASM peptide maturase GrrM/OscB [Xanthobacter sp. KR7-65]|uniref:cyclophane-forming radical SAM/SPASM peptide maturase GrrM/OscB n=1 Tax=Xanthobacter sp. KR7-65 TaxID=3156612 RepID=UPI0032B57957
MPAGRLALLVLQPTAFCNLDCSYCYLPHRDRRGAMGIETLDAIARNIISSPRAAPRLSVVWHGGEPMTLPPAWYEAAFSRLAAGAAGRAIDHCFQTNAIGVDDDWIDLWRRWNVRIGVSLDGPADLHDARRRTRRGRGSFDLAMRGIARLQAAGHPFHVICVLGARSLEDPDRLIDFFLDNGLTDLCFNVEEEEGGHQRSSLREGGMEALYGAFLARVAARMASAEVPFACREIDGVRSLLHAPPAARSFNPQVNALEIVSVAVDGTLSTFSPELLGVAAPEFEDFAFGNVNAADLDDMLRHPALQRAARAIEEGVAACRRSCAYFDVCGGGAPANKYFELGRLDGTETLYCRLTRKTTLEATLGALEAHAHL